jgi:hypothetical protein
VIKVAVLGLDLPLGKKNISDDRLDKLAKILRSPKVTSLQIELQDDSHLKDAQVVLCSDKDKLDLILMDLEIVDQRIIQDPENKNLLQGVKEALEKENFVSQMPLGEEERKILSNYNLITHKPIICISPEDTPDLSKIIKEVYLNSGRNTFFTANQKELRAWSIKNGASALEAAGVIHSDIQRGFIKAEVASFQDLLKAGGLTQAKAAGYLRLEDKDYLVNDGDFIHFRFNV